MHQIPQTWRGRYGVAFLMVAIGTMGVGAFMGLIAQPMFASISCLSPRLLV
jgi:hypothetical protein